MNRRCSRVDVQITTIQSSNTKNDSLNYLLLPNTLRLLFCLCLVTLSCIPANSLPDICFGVFLLIFGITTSEFVTHSLIVTHSEMPPILMIIATHFHSHRLRGCEIEADLEYLGFPNHTVFLTFLRNHTRGKKINVFRNDPTRLNPCHHIYYCVISTFISQSILHMQNHRSLRKE